MAEAKSKTLLVLNRNYVLTTTKGHSVAFEKGKPTHVPPAIYQEALAIGAIPPDGEEPQVEDVVKTDNAPGDPAEDPGRLPPVDPLAPATSAAADPADTGLRQAVARYERQLVQQASLRLFFQFITNPLFLLLIMQNIHLTVPLKKALLRFRQKPKIGKNLDKQEKLQSAHSDLVLVEYRYQFLHLYMLLSYCPLIIRILLLF